MMAFACAPRVGAHECLRVLTFAHVRPQPQPCVEQRTLQHADCACRGSRPALGRRHGQPESTGAEFRYHLVHLAAAGVPSSLHAPLASGDERDLTHAVTSLLNLQTVLVQSMNRKTGEHIRTLGNPGTKGDGREAFENPYGISFETGDEGPSGDHSHLLRRSASCSKHMDSRCRSVLPRVLAACLNKQKTRTTSCCHRPRVYCGRVQQPYQGAEQDRRLRAYTLRGQATPAHP